MSAIFWKKRYIPVPDTPAYRHAADRERSFPLLTVLAYIPPATDEIHPLILHNYRHD